MSAADRNDGAESGEAASPQAADAPAQLLAALRAQLQKQMGARRPPKSGPDGALRNVPKYVSARYWRVQEWTCLACAYEGDRNRVYALDGTGRAWATAFLPEGAPKFSRLLKASADRDGKAAAVAQWDGAPWLCGGDYDRAGFTGVDWWFRLRELSPEEACRVGAYIAGKLHKYEFVFPGPYCGAAGPEVEAVTAMLRSAFRARAAGPSE